MHFAPNGFPNNSTSFLFVFPEPLCGPLQNLFISTCFWTLTSWICSKLLKTFEEKHVLIPYWSLAPFLPPLSAQYFFVCLGSLLAQNLHLASGTIFAFKTSKINLTGSRWSAGRFSESQHVNLRWRRQFWYDKIHRRCFLLKRLYLFRSYEKNKNIFYL